MPTDTGPRRRGRPRDTDNPAFLARARDMASAVDGGRPVKAVAYDAGISLPTAYRHVSLGRVLIAAEAAEGRA